MSAWELTAAMSPRASVQVLTDADENLYSATRAIVGDAPDRAWAMHLADKHGYFRWICFDLDSSRGNVFKDAKRLTHWLQLTGIHYLECLSGPTGGRHLWISVDHIHAQAVNTLAVLAKQLLPTLDISPLSARGNGAVRPPLSPHRISGHSRPLGNVNDLVTSTPADAAMLLHLEQLLSAEGAALPTPQLAGTLRGVVLDSQGSRYLAGDRRAPSLRISTLLDGTSPEIVAMTDKSQLQMTVLSGLARAHWRFEDVEKHLKTSAAFEHSRTVPVPGGRIPRPKRNPRTVLFNDWLRAVEFVAMNPLSRATDSDYEARVAPLVAAVEAAQARADAVPGFWGTSTTSRTARAHAGRPSWRSVFDAVCLYILQSGRPDPQINGRRVAEDTGYSEEACRVALNALVDHDTPWLVCTEEAEGVLASRYTLHPRLQETLATTLSTDGSEQKWAQGGSNPPPATPQRATPRLQPLTQTLHTRLATLRRDLFSAPRSLGRAAGRLLQHLHPSETATTRELSTRTRLPHRHLHRLLQRLHHAGTVIRIAAGWTIATSHTIDAIDRESPSYGYLHRRGIRMRAEGARWRWWLAELTWRRLPRKQKRRRRAPEVMMFDPLTTTNPSTLAGAYPAYPLTPRGNPDHRGALQLILAGAVADVRRAA